MGYRIRVVPEVRRWLAELRVTDAGAADLVDAALVALRDRGSGMGPPLVVPVEEPSRDARPDLEYAYQRQLETMTYVRRTVAGLATSRKRLELQIQQLEQAASKLEAQLSQALETGSDELAAQARDRQPAVAAQLADLRRQFTTARTEEDRLTAASSRLQLKVDNFRTRKEVIAAADAAADAADLVKQAEAELGDAGAAYPDASRQVPSAANPVPGVPNSGRPGKVAKLELNELRPGAPELDDIRILFTVETPGTAVILAAGTERDWLRSWYAESVLRARVRYERNRGDSG
jgi:phage shock protein A